MIDGKTARIWLLLLGLFSYSIIAAQVLNEGQRAYLNKEIRFLNESVHRMVIVHQVYENYNSQISEHVDLPRDEGIQNTSKHLPPNLFADNSLVRKGDSPLELYNQLVNDPFRANMPLNSWSLIEQTKKAIDLINQDRRRLDQIIETGDLEELSAIQDIYSSIENTAQHFDHVRGAVQAYERLYQKVFHDQELLNERKQIYTALLELHYDIKKLVRQLREDSRRGVANNLSKIEKELKWLNACINKLETVGERSELKGAIVSVQLLVDDISAFLDDRPIPEDYEPYGSSYYTYNYKLLPKINEYGSGYVWKLEEFFRKYDWPVLHLLEEPHFVKVIYPEVIPEEVMKDDSLEPDLDIRSLGAELKSELPQLADIVVETDVAEEVEEEPMPYNVILSESIRSDSSWLELDLFDHFKYDGDRVSVSVNGTWVMNNVSLEKGGKKVYLELRPGSINTIIIRADNVGWTTPNTVGVSYMAKRTENNFRVVKDLERHQAIELKVSM